MTETSVQIAPVALLSDKEEKEFREELRERFLESITPEENED